MSSSSNFVGKVPAYYDQGLGPVLFHHYADDISRRAAEHDPSNLLELAAGTGIVTKALRRALPESAEITATDLNQPMLEMARQKLEGEGGVGFSVADAQGLPYDAEVFDSIVCQFGIMFFPDKLQSLKEACRVLKPGGHYIFNVWRSWKENPFAEVAHQTIAKFFDGDPPRFYEVPFGYHDVDEIEATVLEAGFGSVFHTVLKHNAPINDLVGFSKALVYGNPIREEILARDGDPMEVVNSLELTVRKIFGKDKVTPLEAIVFTATK